ncbi:hypothetical protein KSP40_PGU013510 [Platanthera guangdongensis]|uniref:Uncharacterized protein n=1 Tax=Platanthera guangdongensis TaxID=2320717 RepID=A0ABR2LVT9_9ASPA
MMCVSFSGNTVQICHFCWCGAIASNSSAGVLECVCAGECLGSAAIETTVVWDKQMYLKGM